MHREPAPACLPSEQGVPARPRPLRVTIHHIAGALPFTDQETESQERSEDWLKVTQLGSCRAGLASNSHRGSRSVTAFSETTRPVHTLILPATCGAEGPSVKLIVHSPLALADGNY